MMKQIILSKKRIIQGYRSRVSFLLTSEKQWQVHCGCAKRIEYFKAMWRMNRIPASSYNDNDIESLLV